MDVDDLRRAVPVRRAQRRPARASCSRPARRSVRRGRGAVPRGRARRLLVGAARRPRRAGAPGRARGGRRPRDDGPPGRLGRRLPGLGPGERLPRHGPRRPAPDACSGCRRRRSASSTRAWFPFGVHLIEGFFQTVRSMDSLSRQREALVALGTLAAGSPTRSTTRPRPRPGPSTRCRTTCDTLLASLVELAERSLPAEQFIALDALRREIAPPEPPGAASIARGRRSRGGARRLAGRATASRTPGASRRRSRPPASTSPGASGSTTSSTASTLEPGLDWVAGTLSTTDAARGDEGVDRRGSRPSSTR